MSLWHALDSHSWGESGAAEEFFNNESDNDKLAKQFIPWAVYITFYSSVLLQLFLDHFPAYQEAVKVTYVAGYRPYDGRCPLPH